MSTLKKGTKVRVLSVGTVERDDDGKVTEDTRPTGTIASAPHGEDVPDVIMDSIVVEVALDDSDLVLAFDTRNLEELPK